MSAETFALLTLIAHRVLIQFSLTCLVTYKSWSQLFQYY